MTDDRQLLVRLFEDGCRRLDAGTLATRVAMGIPDDAVVLGLGKVAHRMVRAAVDARPDLTPLVSIATSAGPEAWAIAGDHPIPGDRSLEAGEAILEATRAANGRPIAFFLGGGGSALASTPLPGLTLDDERRTTELLLSSGLPVERVNDVRKALSVHKGGGLVRCAPDSEWSVFVLSDVPSGDPSAVASGPCDRERASRVRARLVCERARLWERLPPAVRRVLSEEDPPPSPAPPTDLRVLADMRMLGVALEAAAPIDATVVSPVHEDVDELVRRWSTWAHEREGSGPALLVATGEPTVAVHGPGRGGRAQHLALLMARALAGLDATFLAAGTDGRDGPTAHAGAIVDGTTAALDGFDDAIARFDSATFHARHGTALAGFEPVTHLGDVFLLLVR